VGFCFEAFLLFAFGLWLFGVGGFWKGKELVKGKELLKEK
jgi:hypothetical protein